MSEAGGATREKVIAVFIADSQTLFRHAVRQVLPKDMAVVGESVPAANLWTLVKGYCPDVVLIDISSSDQGLAAAQGITTRCPGVAAIIMSSQPDDEQLLKAVKAGAAAFINKNIDGESLIKTIRQAAGGERPINDNLISRPDIARKVFELFQDLSITSRKGEDYFAPLSLREKEVLQRIACGSTNKHIGLTLGISEQTVKNHISSILHKLEANDRTHAVVLAMRKGLLYSKDVQVTQTPKWLQKPFIDRRLAPSASE